MRSWNGRRKGLRKRLREGLRTRLRNVQRKLCEEGTQRVRVDVAVLGRKDSRVD